MRRRRRQQADRMPAPKLKWSARWPAKSAAEAVKLLEEARMIRCEALDAADYANVRRQLQEANSRLDAIRCRPRALISQPCRSLEPSSSDLPKHIKLRSAE